MLHVKEVLLTLLATLIVTATAALGNDKAFLLYQKGEKEEARAAFAAELQAARKLNDPRALWNALMRSAWFADEIGEPKDSIVLSNEALEVASKIDDDFMIGRSLCWLGWAYSSIGRYESAIQFYNEAVDIGAPDGKIAIIPVWGLASQELGAIYFKMGETAKAKEILQNTTKVARENGVLAGVAEGAAHLSDIAFVEGNVEEAWRWANEAVNAALSCNCSPFNLARARTTKAKVALERAQRGALSHESAIDLINEALNYSKKVGVKTCQAQAMILKSRSLPATNHAERRALLEDAINILEKAEHETRGTAKGALGDLFLAENDHEFAEKYLKQGLKINEEMLRQIDTAYIISSIADLEGLKGDHKRKLEELKRATDLALVTGDLRLAFQNSKQLAKEFLDSGYDSMAKGWYESALDTLEKLIKKEEQPEVRRELEAQQVDLMTAYSELSATLAKQKHDPSI